MNQIHYKSNNQNWETPQELFDQLNDEFRFDVDLCASENNTKCSRYVSDIFNPEYTKGFDGFSCFMNPPYGKGIYSFIKKAYDISEKCVVVCLLPARTDTKWWSIFWDHQKHAPREGVQVRFLKGRLKFIGSKHSAPFPSAIVVMDRRSANL